MLSRLEKLAIVSIVAATLVVVATALA